MLQSERDEDELRVMKSIRDTYRMSVRGTAGLKHHSPEQDPELSKTGATLGRRDTSIQPRFVCALQHSSKQRSHVWFEVPIVVLSIPKVSSDLPSI